MASGGGSATGGGPGSDTGVRVGTGLGVGAAQAASTTLTTITTSLIDRIWPTSRDAVLDLPEVIEHVPGHAADEIARRPHDATAWPARRYLPTRRRCQRVQDYLAGAAELLGQVLRFTFLKLPGEPREIA